MKKSKFSITQINAASSLLLQFVTIISGFIIPKIILKYFGSEVNGLISSLNQFLNYIEILEGGLTGVVMASLYKPLVDKDFDKVSSIVKSTQKFYMRLSSIFIIYTLVLSILYPLLTSSNFSFGYVASLTWILSITLFIQYSFSLSFRLLLQADKKVYVVSFVQIIFIIINILIFKFLTIFITNIHLLKLCSAIGYLVQPIIYYFYITKNYKLNKNAELDYNFLKSRWDGFAINIAAFVHYNTDIAILTMFTNLSTVSVYSVYSLVTVGLRKIVTSISSGIAPSVGHLYATKNVKKLNQKFDSYETFIFSITFFLFTVGGLLITPFIEIYTSGIKDVNYIQPLFGVLIIISEMIFCLREPYITMAYSANKFKDLKLIAYIEAVLNIVISLILVSKYGLVGVTIGTIIAMMVRTIYHVIYLKSHILKRNFSHFIKKIIVFSVFVILSIMFCKFIYPFDNINILNWIVHAIFYSVIVLLFILGANVLLRKNTKYELE